MIRVLIVDNQETIYAKIQMRLATEPDLQVVGLVANGKEALARMTTAQPDMLLMDVQPIMDDRETIHQIQQQYPQCKILILTHLDKGRSIVEALQAGAKGYLLRDTEHLARSIRLVHQGYAQLSPGMLEKLVEQVAIGDSLGVYRSARCRMLEANRAEFDRLTRREQQVLRAISQGLNNREIAAALVLSVSTVRTHISNIISRLDIEDRFHLRCYANQVFVDHQLRNHE
jgi:DNA-binding NarL/FixJ family response regulator